ncbi:uncharacterized protein LOC126983742 isoform X1 [Eriocheir sinensis]|uniref:uncharacterized protein LOC126983742 isoform X1 n=1 Tax=Eriocheir sinensis TaxID=95602 RepID=UPI0021C784AE|nr:uncharacterized protein LOC126983742 isoform X1 [Eriocheir sinensis]XP_050692770.1 uncharacterized protein LOC126983742 isoform X1 [Eriocheir sinensis]XP_050692771.1 uncharacterized protein LOC126983742 isoform X1 [Eriocheir sinensis]XP_050692772.1 uncharacterized protein LOC126983742 isoform X1 [Eriocheir sinensis]
MHFPAGSQVLFVGEGDFSFVTSLTQGNRCVGAHLTASALQDELSERARGNVELLRGRGVEVALGVDATRLHLHPLTQHGKFTHIVFNFPHVGGKMRIERNRKLLHDFFQSATWVLEVDGCVLVTLCGGQGGVTLDPMARRYDDTWKVILMASHADMVLRSIEKFTPGHYPGYSATGYRSMEKGFCQASALTYTFQVSMLSVDPTDALLTYPVSICDGSVLHLPSFLHTCMKRDIVSDSSSLAGYFFSLLLGVLGGRLSVHRGEKLVFGKEGQEESLRRYSEKLLLREESQEESVKNSETVSKCGSIQELTIGGDTGFRDSSRVDCSEKLMSRREVREGSLKNSKTVSNCGSLQELTSRGDTGFKDSPIVDYCEKLMSRREVREGSLKNSKTVSNCGSLQELTSRGDTGLRDSSRVDCSEKLMSRREVQEGSLKNSETVSNCGSIQELTIGGDTGLRDSPRVDCSEKLMSREEEQEESLNNSETVSNCGSFQEPTVLSHSPCRVNIGGGDTGGDTPKVNCCEKLMSRNEVQEESLNISDGASKSAILPSAQPTISCHSAYRINTVGSLSLDPLIVLLCPGNTETIDHLLSQPQTIRIRNVSRSFVPETKSFAFRDFTEGKMCFTEGGDVGNTLTCYLISVAALAEQCGGVKEDEVWGEGQAVGMREDALTYTPFSLFPSKYTYDLSFWETRLTGEKSPANVSDAAEYGNSNDTTGTSDERELTVSEHRGNVKVPTDNKTSLNTLARNYEAKPTLYPTNATSHSPPLTHTPESTLSPTNTTSHNPLTTQTPESTLSPTNTTPHNPLATQPPVPPPFKTTLDTIITNIGGEALRNYRLMSVYECPKTGRRSFTYRLVYRSWRGALSDEGAKRIHGYIGRQLEKCMGVEVR